MPPKITIAIIAGVRPQYIKIAALQKCINTYNQNYGDIINPIYIDTKQHYSPELSDSLIRELNIVFNHTIKHNTTSPFSIFLNIQKELFLILLSLGKIDFVIIIGDTNASLAGAIAATRLSLPVVHIEAGIRSADLTSVEETNRKMIDHIASVHFCINQASIHNLKNEGISNNVHWVGDPTYELLKEFAQTETSIIDGYLPDGPFVLATLHKDSNVNNKDVLLSVVKGLSDYHLPTLFVTHPKTARLIQGLDENMTWNNIKYIKALPYKEMVFLMRKSLFLFTDSGGLQKEAYYLGKRCVVRRDTLGWNVFIEEGIHIKTGKTREEILASLIEMEKKVKLGEFYNLKTDNFIKDDHFDYGLTVLCQLSNKK